MVALTLNCSPTVPLLSFQILRGAGGEATRGMLAEWAAQTGSLVRRQRHPSLSAWGISQHTLRLMGEGRTVDLKQRRMGSRELKALVLGLLGMIFLGRDWREGRARIPGDQVWADGEAVLEACGQTGRGDRN
jgi:hypothetical protein